MITPTAERTPPRPRRLTTPSIETPRLSRNKFRIQCVSQSRYDFILHIKQIGHGFVETLGPYVIGGFGSDKLDVHSKPLVAALH